MKTTRVGEGLRIDFEGSERELLFMALAGNYETYGVEFDHLPEALQRFWAGTLSTESEWELGDAGEDLKEARLAWRGERLDVLEEWLAADGPLVKKGPLMLAAGQVDLFLAVLNDCRLSLAALHDIDEATMQLHPGAATTRELQKALWEIHFLAFVMERCLEGVA